MIELNQTEAREIIEQGYNMFLTGPAGSGKTHMIKEFVRATNKNVALTATTGIAALNIGGDTIHRFLKLGISTRPEDAARIIGLWNAKKKSTKSWDKADWQVLKNLDVLIIDEVSMLRRDQFELIDLVLSDILDDPRPFGGVQIVLVGDFYQLPPVVTGRDKKECKDMADPYAFQSDLWGRAKIVSVSLNTNYRQSDQEFLDILNFIRIGQTNQKVLEVMKSRVNAQLNPQTNPIKLFPLKKEVERENLVALKALGNEVFVSEAEYTGKKYEVDILKKDCPADQTLYFALDAQIMMLTNDPEGRWVNGSMGNVIQIDPLKIKLYNGSIITPGMFLWERIVNKMKGKKLQRSIVATMSQYPFKLAWSSSIHKSQGLTLDCVDLDLRSCFAHGQAYVALSRVKELSGLSLRYWGKEVVKVDQRVIDFYSL